MRAARGLRLEVRRRREIIARFAVRSFTLTPMKIVASIRRFAAYAAGFCCALPLLAAADIFDGKTLTGWEGDAKWWRVQDSLITGGSLTEKVPHNFFLATTK